MKLSTRQKFHTSIPTATSAANADTNGELALVQGFTLIIERLVVVCIVYVLSCIAYSHYFGAIDRARQARQLLDERTYATQRYVESNTIETATQQTQDVTAASESQPAAAFMATYRPIVGAPAMHTITAITASADQVSAEDQLLPERLP